MEELVHYLERTPKSQRTSRWKQVLQSLPPPLSAALRPLNWKKVYSMKAINASLAKVRMVGFNEKIVRKTNTLFKFARLNTIMHRISVELSL